MLQLFVPEASTALHGKGSFSRTEETQEFRYRNRCQQAGENPDFDLLVGGRPAINSPRMSRYRRILCRIIELCQKRGGGRIFPLPAYRSRDCVLNRHRFLVS